jgi:acyl-CoA thioester hydrolase
MKGSFAHSGGAGMTAMIETYRGTVYPWQCDHMDHMNVMWYVGKFDEGTWNFCNHIGLTPSWLRDQGRGMAAVDQRIAYQSELHAGDVVAVRAGVIEVREKVLRFFQEMRNLETGGVAAVTALVAVHMDTAARKSCALPQDVADKARACIVDYRLPW